jgi:hypothetical protein
MRPTFPARALTRAALCVASGLVPRPGSAQAPAENQIRFRNERLWASIVEFPNFRTAAGNVAGDQVFKIHPADAVLAPGGTLTLSAWSIPARFYEATADPVLPDGEWRKVVFNAARGRLEPDRSATGQLLAYQGGRFTFPGPGEYLVTYRFPASGTKQLPVAGGFAFVLNATPGEGAASCAVQPTAGYHVFLSSRERYPTGAQPFSGFFDARTGTLSFFDGSTSGCSPHPAGELYTDMRFTEAVAANRNQSAWASGVPPLPRDEGVGALYTHLATIGGELAWRFEDQGRASATPRYVVLPLLNLARPAAAVTLPGGSRILVDPFDPALGLLLDFGVTALLDASGSAETSPLLRLPMDPVLYGVDLFVCGLVVDTFTSALSATTTVRTRID